MTEPPNMDEPVTRRELHDSLGMLGGALRAETAKLASDLGAEMAEMKTELRAEIAELRGQMTIDFTRWGNTIIETLRAEIRACMEPMNGVPERVTKLEEELVPRVERLEARVFAPKPRRAAPRGRTRSRRR